MASFQKFVLHYLFPAALDQFWLITIRDIILTQHKPDLDFLAST